MVGRAETSWNGRRRAIKNLAHGQSDEAITIDEEEQEHAAFNRCTPRHVTTALVRDHFPAVHSGDFQLYCAGSFWRKAI